MVFKVRKHLKVILISILLIIFVFFTAIYVLRDNISFLYSSVVLDNQDTILFKCSEFGEKEKLQQILKELPNTDPEFYSLIKDISVYDKSISEDELIMVLPVGELESKCPGKYQFEIWFFGHSDRERLNKYLTDGKLHGIPVFLRNV